MANSKQIVPLTGLRALPCLWIMLFHFSANKGMDGGLWGPDWFTGNAHVAVDVFFTLSGYVLTYTYQKVLQKPFGRREFLVYLGTRAGRIFPAHLAILALFGIAVIASQAVGRPMGNPEAWSATQFFWQALLVHSWTPEANLAWNYVSWSVSVEWFSYLFVLPALLIVSPKLPLHLLAGLSALCWLLYWYPSIHVWPDAKHFIGGPPLIRGGLTFVVGFLTFLLHTRLGSGFGRRGLGDALWILATLLLLLIVRFPEALSVLMLPAIVLLILGCASGGVWSERILAGRVLVYIGTISYSLYLIHPFVQIVSNLVVIAGQERYIIPPLVLLVCNYALSILLGGWSYQWVEEPGRRMVKRWMQRWQTAPQQP